MTFALSRKSYSCWTCHHFEPEDRSASVQGWCRKYAPTGRDLYGPCDACSSESILTTKGDVLTHDGSTTVRQGVGSNGQVLTADSTVTNGIKWATPSATGSPLTTKGDLYTYDTDDQRLPVGSDGQILSANSAQSTGLEWIDNPVKDEYRYLQAESLGEVNSTVGYFSRASVNQNNPSGLALTHASQIYQNGVLTPWLLPHEWRIIDIKVVVSAACVSTGTVGAAPTLRLDFYQVNISNRSLIANGTQRIPCTANAGDIRANNSLTPASTLIYFSKDSFPGGFVEPADSTLMGFEFVNESGSQDTINGFARATAYIELVKLPLVSAMAAAAKSEEEPPFLGSINPDDITEAQSFAKWCLIKVSPNEWCGEYKPNPATVPDPPPFTYPEPTP